MYEEHDLRKNPIGNHCTKESAVVLKQILKTLHVHVCTHI